jgi:hypothetical protein
MKIEDVAKQLAKVAGTDWSKIDDIDKRIFKDIAAGIMMMSSDINTIKK